MRTQPHRSGDTYHRDPEPSLGGSLWLTLGLFGVLIAVSYPVLTATFVCGALAVVAYRRVRKLIGVLGEGSGESGLRTGHRTRSPE